VNKQTSCKKVKVSQLFVIQINLLQNSGNLAKRPKSTILSFSLHFGIFNFYAIFVLGIIFLYMFTNSAIFFFVFTGLQTGLYFFFERKEEKKLYPCLSNGISCHCFEEFKVGGVIFDWLKLLQESKV
jgi:hypothetical protein